MFFKQLFNPLAPSTLVASAFADVSGMLQQSQQMLNHALDVLLENTPLSLDLEDMDDVVDEAEQRVRRTILQHLSVNPQQDLVASLVLVSMVQDAERIGDFARGLLELVGMARSPRTGRYADDLRALVARVRPLFALTERAFRQADTVEAREVIAQYARLRADLKAYRAELATSDLTPDMVIVYAGATQILRRVGAHLANIASTVVQPYDRIRHLDEDA